MSKTRKITFLALLSSLALGLSYVESLIPFYFGIPGMKMGLPNIVIFFVLYRMGIREASIVSLVRILLSFLLFGSLIRFFYSLAGGVLSLALMALLQKKTALSKTTVSIMGAIMHNAGQILIAAFLIGTMQIAYYLPILVLASFVTGGIIGLLSAILIKKVPRFEKRRISE